MCDDWTCISGSVKPPDLYFPFLLGSFPIHACFFFFNPFSVSIPTAFQIEVGYKWINLSLLLLSIRTGWRPTYLENDKGKGWTLSGMCLHVIFHLLAWRAALIWKSCLQPEKVTAAKSLQSCPTLCDPIDGSPPGSPSLGFSRQEHWSGLPFPSPMHESENWKWSCSVVSNS